jgi:hypothetical protein
MPSDNITCPECLTPATPWFGFGGEADPHSYYHCDSCGRSCAVQHGQPGHRTPWVRVAARTPGLVGVGGRQPVHASDSFVTCRPQRDRRRQIRIPTQHVAERAYELHQQCGGQHGHDLDDWLRAERDLVGAHVPPPDGGSGAER